MTRPLARVLALNAECPSPATCSGRIRSTAVRAGLASTGILVVVVVAPHIAHADYVISVVDAQTDAAVATANPGDTLQLALRLTGEDGFTDFGVWVQQTPDMLAYGDYQVAPGFCKTDCLIDPPYFSGQSSGGAGLDWTDGHLATFEVIVNQAALAPSTVLIGPLVEFFAYGLFDVDVSVAPPFVLTIVPEPAALAFLVTGGLLLTVRNKWRREVVRRVGGVF